MIIFCRIIGKDRSITTVKIDARKSNFTYNRGLYTIPREAVNLTEYIDDKKKIEPYPELVFIEGIALPVNVVSGNVQSFLEQTVLANALKQVAHAQSDFMAMLLDYLRHPSKLLILTFVGIIIVAVIGGLIR
jgi:hypothetical protein